MATVTAIYRYPVKGLSAEEMNRVGLIPGECLPHDRRFAIALGRNHAVVASSIDTWIPGLQSARRLCSMRRAIEP